jgi:endonuclease/exonuclease/phosphatase family metal-dependent hydrolase
MIKSLSILTYNIHKGFSVGKFKFLLPKMRQAISRLNPDFVFLQEVQGEHKKKEKRISTWPSLSQFEYIAEKIWPHFAYGKNAIYQAGHHGNAILSKYELLGFENINLSTINRASRSILHSQVEISPGYPIHLMCVHLGLFKSTRVEQCESLMKRIHSAVPDRSALLMAGDFNDWRKDLSMMLEHEMGLNEAFKTLDGDYAKTFPAISPALRNDRIYYRGMTVNKADCFKVRPWRLLSDHLPLYAKFHIRY